MACPPDSRMHMEMMQKHGHAPMIPPGMNYGMYPHPKVLQARSNRHQKKKGKGGHRHQKSHDDMVSWINLYTTNYTYIFNPGLGVCARVTVVVLCVSVCVCVCLSVCYHTSCYIPCLYVQSEASESSLL